MTYALRDYQQAGIDAIRAEFRGGNRRVLLCMPTGAGKTLTASEMVRGNHTRGKRMLWLTDREELADQASEAFEQAGVPHGHIMAGHVADKFASAWIGTIQSFLAWRKEGSRRWTPDRVDLLIIDECFPAGTLVDGIPIEKIKIGNQVNSYNHGTGEIEKRAVKHIFVNPVKALVRVHLSNGRSFVCTPDHPIAVERNGGWEYLSAVEAIGYNTMQDDPKTHSNQEIYQGSGVSRVREDFSSEQSGYPSVPTSLLSGMPADSSREAQEGIICALSCVPEDGGRNISHVSATDAARQGVLLARMQGGIQDASEQRDIDRVQQNSFVGPHEGQQSYVKAGAQAHAGGIPSGACMEAESQGGKRGSYRASDETCGGAGLADGGQGHYESAATGAQRPAALLQDRCGERVSEDCSGSGRGIPPEPMRTGEGRPQDSVSGIARVDRVEVLELGSAEERERLCPGGVVYNIEVEGNHNYFVEGTLVHNCHRTEADSFQKALAAYPDAYVVGLTATPMRGDGRGLGRTYTGMTVPVTMRELLDRGLLVPARYFVPSSQDYATLQRARSGDYSSAELSAWADANPQLVGDAVENFARVCPERRAVAFPPDIKTSVALAERFNAAGISAVHVDGKMKKPERREAMRQFRSGEAQVLTSVNIAIEGLDVPDVSAVLMLRPTKSERIWVQAVGRGLRAAPGKLDCVVLDHAGILQEFGPAEDFTPPELHSKAGKETKGSAEKKRAPAQVVCDGEHNGGPCGTVLIGTNICPTCGTEREYDPVGRAVDVVPGDLEELTAQGRERVTYDLSEKRRWYAELLGCAYLRGKNPGSVFYRYQAKFGEKPPYAWKTDVAQAYPSMEVLAFWKSQDIAYARSRRPREIRPRAQEARL